MNNNEFMAKVTEMVMQDPSMRESLKKLYDELAQIEPSTEQKPDMMYVLTQRVKVATENGEEIYHYHPLVGECLLVPGAVKNQMVCSGNLLELQTLQKSERLSHMCGMREDFQILALKPDEFELLQLLLDETITSIIDNTHKAVEALMLNEAYLGVESISFEKIYQNVMFDLMSKAHGTFGRHSAPTARSLKKSTASSMSIRSRPVAVTAAATKMKKTKKMTMTTRRTMTTMVAPMRSISCAERNKR